MPILTNFTHKIPFSHFGVHLVKTYQGYKNFIHLTHSILFNFSNHWTIEGYVKSWQVAGMRSSNIRYRYMQVLLADGIIPNQIYLYFKFNRRSSQKNSFYDSPYYIFYFNFRRNLTLNTMFPVNHQHSPS